MLVTISNCYQLPVDRWHRRHIDRVQRMAHREYHRVSPVQHRSQLEVVAVVSVDNRWSVVVVVVVVAERVQMRLPVSTVRRCSNAMAHIDRRIASRWSARHSRLDRHRVQKVVVVVVVLQM